MQVSVIKWRDGAWRAVGEAQPRADANLVLWFAAPTLARRSELFETLRDSFRTAVIAGCSTGGEILGDEAIDDAAVAAVIAFKHGKVRGARAEVTPGEPLFDLGARLARELQAPDLKGVYVLSDGVQVNGAKLVEGLSSVLSDKVVVTGGLAGDGAAFEETCVGLDGPPAPGAIAAVGFYGESVRLGWGSEGGWETFGPERVITAAEGNVLVELDGKPALELYKQYLGPAAAGLPGSALLFPLSIRPSPGSPYDVVRTIVGVDEARQALIFAGDTPQGWTAQLMRGSPDNLADGAAEAARQAGKGGEGSLALLVSCIGRKLMMGQRVSDEVESVAAVLGDMAMLGFYSYGEICPHNYTGACTLHNQTMTITVLGEVG